MKFPIRFLATITALAVWPLNGVPATAEAQDVSVRINRRGKVIVRQPGPLRRILRGEPLVEPLPHSFDPLSDPALPESSEPTRHFTARPLRLLPIPRLLVPPPGPLYTPYAAPSAPSPHAADAFALPQPFRQLPSEPPPRPRLETADDPLEDSDSLSTPAEPRTRRFDPDFTPAEFASPQRRRAIEPVPEPQPRDREVERRPRRLPRDVPTPGLVPAPQDAPQPVKPDPSVPQPAAPDTAPTESGPALINPNGE